MKVDENMVALTALCIISVAAIVILGAGAKEIALSLGSGIVGFLSRGAIVKNDSAPTV